MLIVRAGSEPSVNTFWLGLLSLMKEWFTMDRRAF